VGRLGLKRRFSTRRGLLVATAVTMGLSATVAPMLALAGGSSSDTSAGNGPLELSPSSGPAGSTFDARFVCDGLATVAVTTVDAPVEIVHTAANGESIGPVSFTIPVPADQPAGELKVVGVCASYGGYSGYDGYNGYNGCDGYGGYGGYEGYDGYDGYDKKCAIRTFGPAFFTVTAPPTEPTLSIDDVSVVEMDRQTVKAMFTVSLSSPATSNVRVHYETADGSANDGKPAAEDKDYTRRTGSVLLPSGTTSKTIEIPVVGDTLDEGDETFTVVLRDANEAPIGDATGQATIVDNDDPVMISVGDAQVVEGNTGNRSMTVTLTLSRVSDARVRVKYQTVDGTATDGKPKPEDKDYAEKSGAISFDPGTTQTVVTLSVSGDTNVEGPQAFTVVLSDPTAGAIADGSATVTITDND